MSSIHPTLPHVLDMKAALSYQPVNGGTRPSPHSLTATSRKDIAHVLMELQLLINTTGIWHGPLRKVSDAKGTMKLCVSYGRRVGLCPTWDEAFY